MRHETLDISGSISPLDRAQNPYRRVPFTVPVGVDRITIRIEYSGVDEDDSLDMGLFDTEGADWMSSGFRGWSDPSQHAVTLTSETASAGYIPGPLLPGEWQVLLGMSEPSDDVCHYTLKISFDEPEGKVGAIEAPAPKQLSRQVTGDWYRGDLHSHSYHSDATGSLQTLVETAARRGLDFLAVTEHNVVSHWLHLATVSNPSGKGPVLIPGEEVSTYRGHLNVWGARKWLDFRCLTDDDVRNVVVEAKRSGGISSVNHPEKGQTSWRFSDDIGSDAWEVWNGPWSEFNARSLRRWSALLNLGRRVTAVGGSDYHQPSPGFDDTRSPPGVPTTWVYADELSSNGILEGLARGWVFISEGIDGPRMELSASAGDVWVRAGDSTTLPDDEAIEVRCAVSGAAGSVLRLIAGNERLLDLPIQRDDATWEGHLSVRGLRYVRAELLDADERPSARVRAITNPIYLRPAKDRA